MTSSEWSATHLFASYAITLVVLGALDAVWLGWAAKDLYRREMGELMAASPRLLPAVLFYIAYPLAIVYFGLLALDATGQSTWGAAFSRCAALGLVAYGTYDLTNMSVVKNFSVKLALIDMAWGTLASGAAGSAAWSGLRWWASRG